MADKYDYCCRFNGGTNAGHTILVNNFKFAFHLLPSGMCNPAIKNIIGNGVVVHIPSLFDELKQLGAANITYKDRLFISNRAHIVT